MSDTERIDKLEAKVAAIEAQLAGTRVAPADLPEVDINDKFGDPEIRRDPPRWKGESFVGSRMSECSAEYLRAQSLFMKWKAGKNAAEGKAKYAEYDLRDAARALAHAKRKESEAARYGTSGHGASAKHSAPREEEDDGSIPF